MKCFLNIFIILSLSLFGWAEKNEELLSLKLEVKRAIKLGNQYLLSEVNDNGSWSDDEHPAITALVLTALQRSPSAMGSDKIKDGYDWLLDQQQEDGGFYIEGLATYNTSTTIMALLAAKDAAHNEAIRQARAFLIGQQTDWDKKGKDDNPYDGGIGYGGTYEHSDMSNTHLALEAIYQSKKIALDEDVDEQPELDWNSALSFINRCQNLTETNDQEWASDDTANKGGFIYFPSSSKAGDQELKDGTTALRSYGSMSYAGLLSLIYADLSPNDPRVVAVLKWLGNNFTVDENPGMGHQGLFYYYQAMAKSLATSGREFLETKNGEKVNWRRQLGEKLVTLQKADGSWINETSRWWENDPILTTAYAVLALEQVYATM